MNKNLKYNYTYFILPYIIKKKDRRNYLFSLLQNKKIKVKSFDEVEDIELFSSFTENISKDIFYTEEYRDRSSKENFEKLIEKSAIFLEYDYGNLSLGKISKKIKINKENEKKKYSVSNNIEDNENSEEKDLSTIYFSVEKIQIVIFKPGVAFILIKTVVDTNEYEDLLDFNYLFKEILSENGQYKKYQSINIQSKKYGKQEDLKEIIKEITRKSIKEIKEETDKDEFYTFSYACVDNHMWNEETKKEELDLILHKYMRVYSSSFDSEIDITNTNYLEEFKYRKIGITKISSNILSSGMDPYNFTYLPGEYETTYLFAYLYGLYFKTFLTYINKQIKKTKGIEFHKSRAMFIDFTKKVWTQEISKRDKISNYFENLIKTLDANKLFYQIITKYSVYLENNQNKQKKAVNIFRLTLSFVFIYILYLFYTKF